MPTMLDLNLLAVFARVVESGSFAGAARRLARQRVGRFWHLAHAPTLATFLSRYPEISIDLSITDR